MSQKEWFDTKPKIKTPPSCESDSSTQYRAIGTSGRFPPWLHRKLPQGNALWNTKNILRTQNLNTVCEEAKCPNRLECHANKTATFLSMGKHCTRNCGFCDIDFSKNPPPLDETEPQRIANSVRELGLKHVVITMVARDDLSDGGASHLAHILRMIQQTSPIATIEVLTSDFAGNTSSIDTILAMQPNIFNHNIETVRQLTPRVRHKATYERSLEVLQYVKNNGDSLLHVKSGLMVGLGESQEEVEQTLRDLKSVGCDIVTIGQYLQADVRKLRVKAFITPEQFQHYRNYGLSIGIKQMFCGPFVRSSYHAKELQDTISSSKI